MNEGAFPQCLPLLRFHEMLREGLFGEKELASLASHRRLQGEYAAFRQCDRAFQDMLEHGSQLAEEAEHGHHGNHQHHQDPNHQTGEGGADSHMQDSEIKYVGYLHCVSTAMCPSSLKEWYACLEEARDGKRPVETCEVVKNQLERCLRAETEAMFRATQGHAFRPSS